MTWKEVFWSKIEKLSNDECWTWKGAVTHKNEKGRNYGVFYINKSQKLAHRVSFSLFHEIPLNFKGFVLHKCDNPPCCNPNHLWLGTHQDNMKDMKNKGRSTKGRSSKQNQKGENNHNSKLTKVLANEIKILISKGLTNKKIASMFGVTHSSISLIRRGKKWVY